jgi:hypothetical protein
MIEKYFSPTNVGNMLSLSVDTVWRLFENEKDVLVLERPEGLNKRRYRTMRISETALRRVIARLSR